MRKDGHVQGEVIEAEVVRAPRQALLPPDARERVGAIAAQHIGPDFPDVLRIARRKIEIPCPIQPMQLRRPDMAAHRALGMAFPDGRFRGGAQAGKGGGAPEHNAVVLGKGSGEIVV